MITFFEYFSEIDTFLNNSLLVLQEINEIPIKANAVSNLIRIELINNANVSLEKGPILERVRNEQNINNAIPIIPETNWALQYS
jgi:hypothetical protein